MTTTRRWLWQLSYALLGLAFFVGLFLSFAAWSTHPFYIWAAVSLGSLTLLFILNRVLNPPRQPNTCPRCAYDHSGLPPGAPCPECGHARADSTE